MQGYYSQQIQKEAIHKVEDVLSANRQNAFPPGWSFIGRLHHFWQGYVDGQRVKKLKIRGEEGIVTVLLNTVANNRNLVDWELERQYIFKNGKLNIGQNMPNYVWIDGESSIRYSSQSVPQNSFSKYVKHQAQSERLPNVSSKSNLSFMTMQYENQGQLREKDNYKDVVGKIIKAQTKDSNGVLRDVYFVNLPEKEERWVEILVWENKRKQIGFLQKGSSYRFRNFTFHPKTQHFRTALRSNPFCSVEMVQ